MHNQIVFHPSQVTVKIPNIHPAETHAITAPFCAIICRVEQMLLGSAMYRAVFVVYVAGGSCKRTPTAAKQWNATRFVCVSFIVHLSIVIDS